MGGDLLNLRWREREATGYLGLRVPLLVSLGAGSLFSTLLWFVHTSATIWALLLPPALLVVLTQVVSLHSFSRRCERSEAISTHNALNAGLPPREDGASCRFAPRNDCFCLGHNLGVLALLFGITEKNSSYVEIRSDSILLLQFSPPRIFERHRLPYRDLAWYHLGESASGDTVLTLCTRANHTKSDVWQWVFNTVILIAYDLSRASARY